MRRYCLTLFITLCFITLTAPCEQTTEEAYALERLNWSSEVKKQKIVMVENRFGDIRLRAAKDDQLIFHAVAQEVKSFGSKATLISKETEDSITLVVAFPDGEPQKFSQGRVDVALIVPENLALEIVVEMGSLSSKGMKNPIKVKSEKSDISIKTNQSVDLFTKEGNISFTQSGKSHYDHKLKTYSGLISYYYSQLNGEIQVVSSSGITSNSAQLLQSKRVKNRTHIYSSGKAKQSVKIQSDTGFVLLLDQQHM